MEKLFSTGEVANLLGLKLRDVDYACQRQRAGHVVFVGGRRALTAANVRQLARHFGKSVPACCREEEAGVRVDVRQMSVCEVKELLAGKEQSHDEFTDRQERGARVE